MSNTIRRLKDQLLIQDWDDIRTQRLTDVSICLLVTALKELEIQGDFKTNKDVEDLEDEVEELKDKISDLERKLHEAEEGKRAYSEAITDFQDTIEAL